VTAGEDVLAQFEVLKDTPYRRLEFQRRRLATLEGVEFWIVSVEDLIISKLEWSKDSRSEMQLRDIRNLLFSGRKLDLDASLREVLS